jgi:hypothetical protein
MDSLTLSRTLLCDTPCPVCSRNRFHVRPGDDPEQALIRYVATCTSCGHRFEVERPASVPPAGRPCARCPDGALEPVLRRRSGSSRFEVAWICHRCAGALLSV